MAIEGGELIAGTLLNKAVKLVREWAKDHQQELLTDWQYSIELKPLQRIPGADND